MSFRTTTGKAEAPPPHWGKGKGYPLGLCLPALGPRGREGLIQWEELGLGITIRMCPLDDTHKTRWMSSGSGWLKNDLYIRLFAFTHRNTIITFAYLI